jgi:hypothetical protein
MTFHVVIQIFKTSCMVTDPTDFSAVFTKARDSNLSWTIWIQIRLYKPIFPKSVLILSPFLSSKWSLSHESFRPQCCFLLHVYGTCTHFGFIALTIQIHIPPFWYLHWTVYHPLAHTFLALLFEMLSFPHNESLTCSPVKKNGYNHSFVLFNVLAFRKKMRTRIVLN